ncbi:ABC-type nitrate/sulfonate/bicarbonate transport system, permease component [Sinosporangium album]|uniref:ABC-type nitrate/sulfonate/bicarbonate transport system, permease component n=1 Tax=Sinosporangium album TaxID=504805 RepID=A0A1G7ZNV7_9ACTN|nr:ABC transporter permease [Sinosporangium album]SDH10403.1 ABC-type nitrate/sulfonate/bicarbonate transport system, permease component [Sinosporangium album]
MRAPWRRGLVGVGVFVALLEVVPRTGLVDPGYLPTAGTIAGALGEQLSREAFWSALLDTLRGWSIGLGIAVVAGVAAGIVIGVVPALRAFTASTVEFLRPIPSVALIPLAVLMFGTSMQSTLVLIVYASFWQVLVQVLDGVRDVDPVTQETARSYGFAVPTRIRVVVWPAALPNVITGIRLAATVALVLAITGELVIGSPGLGRQIALAQSAGAVEAMYGLVVVAGLLGVAVNLSIRAAERRLLRWHVSVRRENAV